MIHYKVNILAELKKAGYTSAKLQGQGILSASTQDYLRNNKIIKLEAIDRVCQILHCDIGDLIEILPDRQEESAEEWLENKQFIVILHKSDGQIAGRIASYELAIIGSW